MADMEEARKQPDPAKLVSGMIFDCARRYFPVDTIKALIDVLSGREGAFLQLHLTDNQKSDRSKRLHCEGYPKRHGLWITPGYLQMDIRKVTSQY